MGRNRLIAIAAYLFLIAGCMGIVFLIDRAVEFPSFQEPGSLGTEPEASLPGPENKKVLDTQEQEKGKVPQETEKEEQGHKSGGRRKWYTAGQKAIPQEIIQPEEEPKGPPRLILATDIHYMSSKLTDYGATFSTSKDGQGGDTSLSAFDKFVAGDDGKVVRYSQELTDAFLHEVEEYKPDAVILSGDLTVNGEKVNHQELAGKLSGLQKKGIQVLVIPGNHDINNPNAASYIGEEREETESVTPEEFYQIYHSFGYDQAASRDEASLSYRYVLDSSHWLLMLDSCQYEPYNKVGGKIKEDTYVWIRSQYEEAKKAGAVMIPVSHHNLMGESRVYPTECAIEGGEEMISILGEYEVPLYLSGHLHLQRIKKYQEEPGTPKEEEHVTEAVTGSLSIAPCQYGVIEWEEDGSLSYGLRTVDVSKWAWENRIDDENLLDFEAYSETLVKQVVSDQIYKRFSSLPDDMKRQMSDLYGQVNYDYCVGKEIDRAEIKNSKSYHLWERTEPDSKYFLLLEKMIADLDHDNISWRRDAGS
ncbi:metallophosphoesterase [Lachnospiraceae bacterium 62-35]